MNTIETQLAQAFRCPKCSHQGAHVEKLAMSGTGISRLLEIQAALRLGAEQHQGGGPILAIHRQALDLIERGRVSPGRNDVVTAAGQAHGLLVDPRLEAYRVRPSRPVPRRLVGEAVRGAGHVRPAAAPGRRGDERDGAHPRDPPDL